MKKNKLIAVVTIIGFAIIANIAVASISKTSSTATPSTSLSASVIYPEEVYCPTGMVCSFPGPTFIVNL